jgi:hypothetical protein
MKPTPISAAPHHCGAATSTMTWRRITRAARRAVFGAYLRMQVATLMYRANSSRLYIADCSRDGLVDSLNVRRFRAQAEADEARANAIKARLRTRAASVQHTDFDAGPLLGAAVVVSPWLLLAAAFI